MTAFDFSSLKNDVINDTCIDRINRLYETLREQGASLVVAGYPIAYGEFTPDRSLYVSFENELRERLECDVISHYTDYFYPYDLFYNASLHLTEEGAIRRTEQLISDLSQWMELNGSD